MTTLTAEYVWIDNELNLRSKTRVFPRPVVRFPYWTFDGSSTGQAGSTTEITLVPVFHRFHSQTGQAVVLCECEDEGKATATNHRREAKTIFDTCVASKSCPTIDTLHEEPWFGLEQEYVITHADGQPLMPLDDPNSQKHYCSPDMTTQMGRVLAEQHLQLCLDYGLKMSGLNAEVAPGQWEFQVGPCAGVEAGDQLWVARYLLIRLSSYYGYGVSFDPKPYGKAYNGSGMHCNFSTTTTRTAPGGFAALLEMMPRLSAGHSEFLSYCGTNNEQRLTGTHETSNPHEFSYGVGQRDVSVRIPILVQKDGQGYLEDRRPGANANPYLVTAHLFAQAVL